MKEQADCFGSYKLYCVMDDQICHMAFIKNKTGFKKNRVFLKWENIILQLTAMAE